MRKTTCLTLFLLLLLLAACGKKGPVRPRAERLPGPVTAVSLAQRGTDFLLQWHMPEENLDGSPLDDLDQVYVERLLARDEDFCAECSVPWPLLARISPQLPDPALRINDTYLLSDREIALGGRIHYRLRVRNRQGDFGPEIQLAQLVRPGIAAPTDLLVAGHDSSADLRWQEASPPTGTRLLGYQIYRRAEDAPFSPLPLNQRPLEKPTFSDFGLENGRLYHYRVRSLFEIDGDRLESLPSREVSTIPAAG